MNPHLAILHAASLFVPHRDRALWLADWRSELWYVRRLRGRREALAFSLGAVRDAIFVRRSQPFPARWLQSPVQCLSLLAVTAGLCAFFFLQRPPAHPAPLLAQLFVFVTAIVILPATMTLTFGEYPRVWRCRRSLFIGIKLILVIAIVFCGTSDLAPLIAPRGLQPQATLIGYVLGLRWALLDQRRRCPVCLRLLANPTRIGRPSQTFLDWYGTEMFCPKGHGLMHASEITASYATHRWIDLDRSWSSLFS